MSYLVGIDIGGTFTDCAIVDRAGKLLTTKVPSTPQDFSQGMMHVRRIKNGIASVQQIGGEEMRMLRALKREDAAARYVFMTERGAPMTAAGFRKLLSRLAAATKFPFGVHPHMLRHATGYKLANDGRDTRALQHYLGHKNIMHTVRYTELSPDRFKHFWED